MKKIFEDSYVTFTYSAAKSIFIFTWKAASARLTTDLYLIAVKRIIEACVQNQVQYVIANSVNFKFTVTPDVQVTIATLIFSKLNNSNVKKIAHIASVEMIAQLGKEQLFEEIKNKNFVEKYFENLKDAVDWCNS